MPVVLDYRDKIMVAISLKYPGKPIGVDHGKKFYYLRRQSSILLRYEHFGQ